MQSSQSEDRYREEEKKHNARLYTAAVNAPFIGSELILKIQHIEITIHNKQRSELHDFLGSKVVCIFWSSLFGWYLFRFLSEKGDPKVIELINLLFYTHSRILPMIGDKKKVQAGCQNFTQKNPPWSINISVEPPFEIFEAIY